MNELPHHTNSSQSAGTVMLSLIHAGQLLEDRIESALGTVGLSLAKYRVLALLTDAAETLTLSDLAEKASCVRSNITQLVDRLEADGLVQRIDDPADRRVKRAQLTPLGKERYAAGVQQMERVQTEFTAEVPEIERRALARVLSAMK
jgi:DNA-binding MarR family transcriptional regulator